MTPLDIIHELSTRFPDASFRYENDDLADMHLIEIRPLSLYNSKEFNELSNALLIQYIEANPNENLSFINEHDLIGIQNVMFELKPKDKKNIYSQTDLHGDTTVIIALDQFMHTFHTPMSNVNQQFYWVDDNNIGPQSLNYKNCISNIEMKYLKQLKNITGFKLSYHSTNPYLMRIMQHMVLTEYIKQFYELNVNSASLQSIVIHTSPGNASTNWNDFSINYTQHITRKENE